jgi:hypothetical protein
MAPANGVGSAFVGHPGRITLHNEVSATFGFVSLTDSARRVSQSAHRSKEPAVLLVAPAHVATAAPAVCAKAIETAVVADSKRGVLLDVVAPELAELRPAIEKARVVRHHRGYCRTPIGKWLFERCRQSGQCGWWLTVEHGGRRPVNGQVHRTGVGHAAILGAQGDFQTTGQPACHQERCRYRYRWPMLALTTDSAKSTAIIGIVVMLVVALAAVFIIKAIITKIISLAVAALLAFGFYSQRVSIQDCAKKAKDNAATIGESAKTECSFFGVKVKLPTDKLPKPKVP